MDGIAFNWSAGDFCKAAAGWVRPRRLLARLDALAALIALTLSYVLLARDPQELEAGRFSHLIFQILIGVSIFTLLYKDGQYSPNRRMSRVRDVATMIKNSGYGFFFVCGVWFVTDGFFTGYRDESRMVIFSGVFILLGVLTLNRLAVTWYQQRMFARGEGMRNVLLVGQGRVAAELKEQLEQRPWLGVRCVGTVPARSSSFSIARIRAVLKSGQACDLVLAMDPDEHAEYDAVIEALNRADIPFSVVPSLFEESVRAAREYGFREPPVINIETGLLDKMNRVLKRIVDIIVSGLALLVIMPFLALIALAVKLDSAGPIIFRQTRLGYAGRPFEILKFRTMVPDAETRLQQLAALDEGDGPHFKMKHDPRITQVGRFLRAWSLDELLQFVNVLKGDMSLVGPRPPLPREVDQYETHALVRLKGKPGITGLWQVSGRKDCAFSDMVKLDRQYLETWSLSLDLGILFRTVSVVLARKGAY